MIDINVKNYTKRFKKTLVLDDVNLHLASGKIYGFKGKNGSGKTMLMRAICGLIIPTEGEIVINNEVLHRDIDFPRSIGALIETPSFLNSYSGFVNLKMLANLNGDINDSQIKTALNKVGLNPEDKKPYRKYSLGMKQKLGIANAIMGEPDIVILDEPINALDEESVSLIKQELILLKNAGKLIIVACHDREELEFLSDVIIEIKDGKINGIEELVHAH